MRGSKLLQSGAAALALIGALGGWSLGSRSSLPEAQAQAPSTVVARKPTLRLITQSQYQNTIASIFGADIAIKVRFAPLERVDGLLAVGASRAAMTGGSMDLLESTARQVSEQVFSPERRDYLMPCRPANSRKRDDACARTFFSAAGRMLFRRPLTQTELDTVVETTGTSVSQTGDFYSGMTLALSGMLVSPQFLYIWENLEADPVAAGQYRLDGWSKASRLSYLIWNSAPDDQLLHAAETGELHTEQGLRRQLDRMLSSPLYKDGVRAFFDDFLVNEMFDTLAKDASYYPAMTVKAIGEAREQLLRTAVDHLVDQHGDYRDLFTTHRTFLSSDLAALYRVPLSTGSQGWVPYEFPANDPRAGIQSQIGFLAKYAHPARSSSTRRGRAIREVLLCQRVPDPPPNVDFSKFEDKAGEFRTARARLSVHNENPVCAGCHRITDPIGLSLENFDGAGQYRAAENGVKIDASGSLDEIKFEDPIGLGKALRDNASLKSCIVNRLYAYSVGQKIGPESEPVLHRIGTTLETSGYRFDQMLRLMVLDDSFFAVERLGGPTKTAMLGDNHAH